MLKKSHFFLQFFWILGESIDCTYILSVTWTSFHIIYMMTIRIQNNFSRVIEENTRSFIRQIVTQSVFCWIVDPFLYPNFWNLSGCQWLYIITNRNPYSLWYSSVIWFFNICWRLLLLFRGWCNWGICGLILKLFNISLRWWASKSCWWQ